jgi:hypothetical protein
MFEKSLNTIEKRSHFDKNIVNFEFSGGRVCGLRVLLDVCVCKTHGNQ